MVMIQHASKDPPETGPEKAGEVIDTGGRPPSIPTDMLGQKCREQGLEKGITQKEERTGEVAPHGVMP